MIPIPRSGGIRRRALGVAAAGIVPADGGQIGLFADERRDRRRALNSALDRVVARFGEGVVSRGGYVVEKDPTTQVKRGT